MTFGILLRNLLPLPAAKMTAEIGGFCKSAAVAMCDIFGILPADSARPDDIKDQPTVYPRRRHVSFCGFPRQIVWRHVIVSLALSSAILACSRQDMADPDAMAHVAGIRAGQFYKLVSERRLPEASAFFSERLRAQHPDPLQEPLLRMRSEDRFGTAISRLERVDWRKRHVYFRVSLSTQSVGASGVRTLNPQATRIDRWIYDGDAWHYDGDSGE